MKNLTYQICSSRNSGKSWSDHIYASNKKTSFEKLNQSFQLLFCPHQENSLLLTKLNNKSLSSQELE